MKINKILSSALVFVMLFTTAVACIPISASADAAAPVVSEIPAAKTLDEVKSIFETVSTYTYETAEELLNYELSQGYLASVSRGEYTIYVNCYTGYMYYVNNVTGQILTSNPIDPGTNTGNLSESFYSQVEVEYAPVSDPSKVDTYYGSRWIKQGNLLSVKKIDGGLSVSYVLGEDTGSLKAPSAVMASSFDEMLANPLFDKFAELLEGYLGAFSAPIKGSRVTVNSYNLSDEVNAESVRWAGQYEKGSIGRAVDAILIYAGEKLTVYSDAYKVLAEFGTHIKNLFASYNINDPARLGTSADDLAVLEIWYEKYPTMRDEDEPVYVIDDKDGTSLVAHRLVSAAITATKDKGITVEQAKELEFECGYMAPGLNYPQFKCTFNYTLDAEGNLVFDMPTSSFLYDDSMYIVYSVTPIKHFGYADMSRDGYIFFPDGSGSIIDFSDFYFNKEGVNNISFVIENKVYGPDYAYSAITGKHREQITMPVYGIVNDVKSNSKSAEFTSENAGDEDITTNGFFAIIEQGASLTSLEYLSLNTNKYASAFMSYCSKPADKCDLSQTISVGSNTAYYIVSEAVYEGSFKTRFTMLADPEISSKVNTGSTYFDADYVGMASCYRDYLENDTQTIKKMTEVYEDIPLYIEALGSLDITKKILTFPVTVSEPLTTFEQVETMYNELSDAVNKLKEKAQEYTDLANELEAVAETKEDKENVEASRETAKKYLALADKVQDIKNINFKLTGFANGGMYYTYPAKLKWEGSVGGKRGFKKLIAAAKTVNDGDDANANFGIYPDFDFVYVNNTASFDGVSTKKIGARMVDNRYASKQKYNSISAEFETLFAIVVSSDSYDKNFSKFNKKYSKLNGGNISVSTLGSDLNSNFDEENAIIRETTLNNVTAILNKMANDNEYSIMTDKGNAYTLGYVDHIVNAAIDSSHFGFSSYAVPFFGMVLHGYINYSGTAINFSGSSDYNILRSIENGAALYYVLCYDNTHYLKEDERLSSYYGINYSNWFDSIVEDYDVLDEAIGNLQSFNIVDHSTILAERIIDADEMAANYQRLVDEFIEMVNAQLSDKITEESKKLREDANYADNINKSIVVTVDKAALKALASELINLDSDELAAIGFDSKLDEVVAYYAALYPTVEGETHTVSFGVEDFNYDSKYSYVTDSVATNKDGYVYTDFTCDNSNVVMVTYANPNNPSETVVFLLNYNVFAVKVKIDVTVHPNFAQYVDEDGCITLGKYDFVKIQ